MKLEFSRQIFEKTLNIEFPQNLVGVELSHADRQTVGQADVTKIIVASHNFANAPKNVEVRRGEIAIMLNSDCRASKM